MHGDVKIHKWSIYTILDLLGDVGGLFDALRAIASVIISLNFALRGSPIEQFLIEQIFVDRGELPTKDNPKRK